MYSGIEDPMTLGGLNRSEGSVMRDQEQHIFAADRGCSGEIKEARREESGKKSTTHGHFPKGRSPKGRVRNRVTRKPPTVSE